MASPSKAAAFLSQLQALETKLHKASKDDAALDAASSDDEGATFLPVYTPVPDATIKLEAAAKLPKLEEDARVLRMRLEHELAARVQHEEHESKLLMTKLAVHDSQRRGAEAQVVELQKELGTREVEHQRALERAIKAAEAQQSRLLEHTKEREGRLSLELAEAARTLQAAQEQQRRQAGEVAVRAQHAMRAVNHAAQEFSIHDM